MSNIQQGINNVISTAALLGEMSGKSAELREKRQLKNDNEKITKITHAPPKGKTIDPEYQNELDERYKKNLKRLYELNPNEKTYKAYAQTIPTRTPEDPEDIRMEQLELASQKGAEDAEYNHAYKRAYDNKYDELRAQEANRHSQSQQTAKKKNRRYFLEYLRKQPTSLGGTVGDFPISKQREIAKQYNRGDRKRMMDRMDKEEKDGKQK